MTFVLKGKSQSRWSQVSHIFTSSRQGKAHTLKDVDEEILPQEKQTGSLGCSQATSYRPWTTQRLTYKGNDAGPILTSRFLGITQFHLHW